jgi:hypothetical protein
MFKYALDRMAATDRITDAEYRARTPIFCRGCVYSPDCPLEICDKIVLEDI